MTGPMLFLVTDHPEKAVRGLLGLSLKTVPAWLSVVSSPERIATLPNDAPVLSVWFSDGSLTETLWREERLRKGRHFDLDYGRHADRIADWLNRAAAREAALIAEYCAERGEAVPSSFDPEAKASGEQTEGTLGHQGAGPRREMRVGAAGRGSQPATSEGGRDGVERHAPSFPQKRASRWS